MWSLGSVDAMKSGLTRSMDSLDDISPHILSTLFIVYCRAALAVSGIICVFLFGSVLVDRLIVRRYTLPEHEQPTAPPPGLGFWHTNSSLDSLDSPVQEAQGQISVSPLIRHFTRIDTFVSSPSLDEDEYLEFDRLLFYKNLNNSSHFLRRDSFVG